MVIKLSSHSEKDQIQSGDFCVEFLCSPHVSMGYLWPLPRSKDMHVVRLTGVSNLAMDVNVSGNGYVLAL